MTIFRLFIDIAMAEKLPVMAAMVLVTKSQIIEQPDDAKVSSPVL